LTQLCALLGPDLAPLTPLPDSVEVTGVHVSELTDPTPYLDGGELLLTTGIPLLAPTAAVHAYVARLQRAGVSGLGFGLGALRDTIPDGLAAACQRLGLALFGVPGPTPFQAIARGYWTLVGQERAAELTSTIGSYRKLVRAAAAPTPQVVRELADTLKGWSVHFDEEGRPLAAWPPEAIEHVDVLRPALARLLRTGTHSAATFPLGDTDVVVYPVPGRDRAQGFIATACRRPMQAAHRDLVLTACSLLALAAERRPRGDGDNTAAAIVVGLILDAHPEAARLVADRFDTPELPQPCRTVLVCGRDSRRVIGPRLAARLWATGAAIPTSVANAAPRAATGELHVGLLSIADTETLWARLTQAAGRDPALTAVAGVATDPESIAAGLPTLLRALSAGGLTDLGGKDAENDHLARLRGYRRADLVSSVVAYLRHRGNWEAAAADIGTHRNSVRYRIARAEQVLDADLDDPDVAARLWLALREAGLA
jgi:purine catabolism regulator